MFVQKLYHIKSQGKLSSKLFLSVEETNPVPDTYLRSTNGAGTSSEWFVPLTGQSEGS